MVKVKVSERSYASEIKSILDRSNLGLYTEVETLIEDEEGKKSTDIIVFKDKNPIIIIEVKRPEIRPIVNDTRVIEQVIEYANKIKKNSSYSELKYIATHNLRHLFLLKFNENEKIWEIVRPIPWKIFPEAEKLDEYKFNIENLEKRFTEFFLDFEVILDGKKRRPEDKEVIEELLDLIIQVAKSSVNTLQKKFRNEKIFRKGFDLWRIERGIQKPINDVQLINIINVLSTEYAYTLTLKFMFYHILRLNIPILSKRLSDFEFKGIRSIEFLKNIFNGMFSEVIKETKDFEIVFSSDFSDDLPVNSETVKPLLGLFNYIREINWRKIEHDILGKIFEKLIYEERRHLLGQYYTKSSVVDIILGFCLKNGNEKIIDTCCGSGTFLIRAYQRLKYLNPTLEHSKIIENLFGIEIEKFPAMLSVINLYVRDPEKVTSPKIANIDFFSSDVKSEKVITSFKKQKSMLDFINDDKSEKKKSKKVEGVSLSKKDIFKFQLPFVDVVATNPPYTRQEEMGEAFYTEDYKQNLIDEVVKPLNIEEWSGKSSIYTYFFLKGTIFLKNNGNKLGFITSNSWLDTQFGECLQKFFLDNFKIITIIESDVEKWFEDADIITSITILEKCNKKEERENNTVKFVKIKVKLEDIFGDPPSGIDYIKMEDYWQNIDKFVKNIEKNHLKQDLKTLNFFNKKLRISENDKYRVLNILQKHLFGDPKWGKFIRAETYFEIINKSFDYFIKLKDIAITRFGIKTNANELFYLPSKHWDLESYDNLFVKIIHPIEGELKISRKYIKPLIKSPKNLENYKVEIDDISFWVFYPIVSKNNINDKGSKEYISWMEKFIINEYINSNKKRFPTIIKKLFNKSLTEYKKLKKGMNEKDLLLEIAKEWGIDPMKFKINGNWATFSDWKPAEYLVMMSYNDRFAFWFNNSMALEDARLYGITLYKEIDKYLIGGILNQTFTYYAIELNGRTNLGLGALDVKVYEYDDLPIINPEKICPEIQKEIIEIYKRIYDRKINSIFDELKLKDRKKLDEIFLCKILGFPKQKLRKLYYEISKLVKNRLERAKT